MIWSAPSMTTTRPGTPGSTDQDTDPLVVTYEDLVADPGHSVHRILRSVGQTPPAAWRPASPHRRQADEVSTDWVRRYHVAYG
jgi:LPS sulfotransferase NodH